MKILSIFLIISAIAFTSCSSSKKAAKTANSNTTSAKTGSSQSTADGLSYETAVFIKETTETTGVHAEYEWIKKHYSNYKIKEQSLNYKGKTPYDIITIILSDGKELPLYFDISNYFGKF